MFCWHSKGKCELLYKSEMMEQLLHVAVVKWCKWFYSIPKNTHPTIDTTGVHSSINQTDPDLWFLAGSFGNIEPIERRCVIPSGRAILFPIIEKEDSFTEDTDLKTESELIRRCSNAMDQVLHVEACTWRRNQTTANSLSDF